MKKNKTLRFLEFIWILIGLTGTMLAAWTYMNNNKGQAAYFAVIAVVSAVFYNIRRKQRKELESGASEE